MEQEKLKELEFKVKKKIDSRKILDEQLEQMRICEDKKRKIKLNDLEEEKKIKEKFQIIMDNKDKERLDIKLQIQEKAKLRDLREKYFVNQKNLQEIIENELENKYRKEKEQIESRLILSFFNFFLFSQK